MNITEEILDEELDKLIREGYIWAVCPHCKLFIESVRINKCNVCKKSFSKEEILIRKVDRTNSS